MAQKKGLKWTVAKRFAYECMTIGRPIAASKDIIKEYWRTATYGLTEQSGYAVLNIDSSIYKNKWRLSFEPSKMPSWIDKVEMQPEDSTGDLKITAIIRNRHTIELMLKPDCAQKSLSERNFSFHGTAYHGLYINIDYYI